MMPGVALGEFQQALTNAFDSADLAQLVRIHLNEQLAGITAPGPQKFVVFQLITWAEKQGTPVVAALARAAYLERPQNEGVRQIYEKFGMAPALSVQNAGAAVAGAPNRTTASALEGIVTGLRMVNMGVWREKMAAVESQVCRIEFNNNPMGTGFLIGPDLVLSNYHVMEKPIEGQLAPQKVTCHFDYKALSDGSRLQGMTVKLHTSDWLVDDSRYSEAEADDDPDRELPTGDQLDYAVIRLQRPVGAEPMGPDKNSGGPPRGWIKLNGQPTLEPDMPLLIVQHPDDAPIKLALDTKSVIRINENGTRVRYATNTKHGSSGSPCFNFDWELVALHHLGDPAWKDSKIQSGHSDRNHRSKIGDQGSWGSAMTNGAAGTARHTTSTVIKLDGAAIGILRDLIVEAFDNADLEQLVRTKLNIGLYDEVAKNQPLRKLVFDLLEVLERRGTTRFLLRATWDARPFNDHFRNGIERLFPGVRETPPSPAEEANMVADGLRSLKDQLGNPAVYTVVSSYRDDLSRLMDEIDVLANYKALHDYLQRIQLQLYPHMVDRVKRFSTDLSAGQELEYHIATLKEICKGAREKAEALPNTAAVQAEQLQWVVILEAAAAELRQTVAALDELRALQALRSLRQVIRNEPFRVNTLLTWTAEKLPLEQLIKTIDEVIKALPVGGDSASDMKGPLQSLQNLLARLGGRVVEHKQWQGIENEFWEAEEFVEKGTPEFVLPNSSNCGPTLRRGQRRFGR